LSRADNVDVRGAEADPIRPVRIDHDVDEIYDDGALEQHYNFLVYQFAKAGNTLRARAYLDEIDAISIFGPYRGETDERVDDPELLDAVMGYLKRRFRRIDRFDTQGTSAYETVWRAPDA
jgi:hypothetical protein